MANKSSETDDRAIVWFDIDNTLYSASSKISQLVRERKHEYFVGLGLSNEEAFELYHRYRVQYKLVLRGLKLHHGVDALDFDRKCDGSLPLETMLSYDPKLRKLFEDIDRSKFRVWALTNAYKLHATRVLKILKLDDVIDGLVYCDYTSHDFPCKPEPEFYQMAMREAGVTDPTKCYFIDDKRTNVNGALAQGWRKCVHLCEKGLEAMEGDVTKQVVGVSLDTAHPTNGNIVEVSSLEQLRIVWLEIFQQQ